MEWKIVGIIAAVCTTTGFIPQIIRGIRTKKLEDISPIMYVLLIIGLSLWLSYGVHLKDVIIIAANAAALVLSVFILILRYKYMRQKKLDKTKNV
ncbi:MAG: SemiSWEET family sugar transporter [Candidatus Scalindua sp.]